MTAPDWDLLIHRHLEGTIGEEEARALSAQVVSDPAIRRRLAEMAFDQAQLRELLVTENAAPARERARWSKGSIAAAASILVAVAVALVIGFSRRDAPVAPEVPASPPSASLRIRGTVSGKKDQAMTVTVVDPGTLAGRIFRVVPGRDRSTPDPDHLLFLRKCVPGQEVHLEVRLREGDEVSIVSLTADQVRWAREDKRKPDKGDKKPEPRKPPVREGSGDRDGEK